MKRGDLLVSNIQRFSLHDGPGIRTTVFLKGCSLHCPWCSNPENIEAQIQEYDKNGKKGFFGYYISAESLTEELLKDRAFYGEYSGKEKDMDSLPGGVTFSGGEPLLQIDTLVSVCEALHEKKIHLAAETSLFVTERALESALAQIDLFLVDVKILDEKRARETEGGRLTDYLRNLDHLMQADKTVVVRIPLIAGYTDDTENMRAVIELIKKHQQRIDKVELIKGHDLGASKYRALGMEPVKSKELSAEKTYEYQDMIQKLGVRTELCTI